MMNKQVRKMGGVSKLISALPGGDKALGSGQVDEGALDAMEVIINSMTKAERSQTGASERQPPRPYRQGRRGYRHRREPDDEKFNETKKMVKQAPPASSRPRARARRGRRASAAAAWVFRAWAACP